MLSFSRFLIVISIMFWCYQFGLDTFRVMLGLYFSVHAFKILYNWVLIALKKRTTTNSADIYCVIMFNIHWRLAYSFLSSELIKLYSQYGVV